MRRRAAAACRSSACVAEHDTQNVGCCSDLVRNSSGLCGQALSGSPYWSATTNDINKAFSGGVANQAQAVHGENPMAQSTEAVTWLPPTRRPVAASIVWLGDPASLDRTLVGGKVAHLSRLAGAFRVPPGFCLTTAAFDQAVADGWRVDGAGGQDLPAPLKQDVAAAYQALAERCGIDAPPVAVRSSAVDEDGALASFAGQYASYLHVRGAGHRRWHHTC
jgi:hypothetical protein